MSFGSAIFFRRFSDISKIDLDEILTSTIMVKSNELLQQNSTKHTEANFPSVI